MVEDPDSFVRKIRRLYENRHEKSQDEVKLKDGRTLFRYSAPLFGKDETYYGRLWLYRDITPQKQALEEKDFLMKELNHRVKNNLLMVTSLINLKESSLGDTVDLSDIAHQVDTIRIVHEKLFKKEQITTVRLPAYLREIIDTIFSSFAVKDVTVDCRIPDISLPTRDAVSLGLIVNEIATNAVKHGFSDEQAPAFSVEMDEEAGRNRYVLKLANRGKPFPENVDLDNPQTLGLQLVSALISQLQGTLELKRGPHPVFTIRFPKPANA
jgi:two-component sensor histidine kinase